MHPEICCFPSVRFYEGQLKTADLCWQLTLPRWFETNHDTRVVFIESDVAESRNVSFERQSSSYRNHGEAEVVISTLEEILKHNDVKTVALLTPYKGQEILLEELVIASEFKNVQICVSTVDGFQVSVRNGGC